MASIPSLPSMLPLSAPRFVRLTNCSAVIGGLLRKGVELSFDTSRGVVVSPSASGLPSATVRTIDLTGSNLVICPGFLDLQCNGAFGIDFSSNTLTADKLQSVLRRLPAMGVTSLLATLISSKREVYEHSIPLLLEAMDTLNTVSESAAREASLCPAVSRVVGLHLEGPFLSHGKRGAHPEANLAVPVAAGAAAAAGIGLDCSKCSSSSQAIASKDSEHTSEGALLQRLQEVYGHRAVAALQRSATAVTSAGAGSASSSASSAPTVEQSVLHQQRTTQQHQQRQEQQPIKVMTLAPELPGALPLTSFLKERGVLVSLGHSSASAELGMQALRAGAGLLTHLFNAMAPFSHREPGLVGLVGLPSSASSPSAASSAPHSSSSALKTSQQPPPTAPFFSVIADGVHVHPLSLAMAARASPSHIIAVTDAMPALGLQAGTCMVYGDIPVRIYAGTDTESKEAQGHGAYAGGSSVGTGAGAETGAGGAAAVAAAALGTSSDLVGFYPGPHAVVEGTTTLAGAVAPLDLCLRNLLAATGWDLAQGLDAVTRNPARALGLQHLLGDLQPGCFADMVLLEEDTLTVQETWIGGRLAWARGEEDAAGKTAGSAASLKAL